jgi:hypothetical protein
MAATNGTQGQRGLEATTEVSRITAVVERRGSLPEALEQRARLIRLVSEELKGAELSHLRLDYSSASRPSHVVPRSRGDDFEVAGRGPTNRQEAESWEFARRAVQSSCSRRSSDRGER